MKTVLVLSVATLTQFLLSPPPLIRAETTHSTQPLDELSSLSTPPFHVVASPVHTGDLQLTLVSSPETLPFLSRDARVRFADLVEKEFKVAGFQGVVYLLDPSDAPVPSLCRLEIRLTRWKVEPGREADCDFAATLLTPSGPALFGNFSGRAVDLAQPRRRRIQAEELKEAATDAIDRLYVKIQAEHLLQKET